MSRGVKKAQDNGVKNGQWDVHNSRDPRDGPTDLCLVWTYWSSTETLQSECFFPWVVGDLTPSSSKLLRPRDMGKRMAESNRWQTTWFIMGFIISTIVYCVWEKALPLDQLCICNSFRLLSPCPLKKNLTTGPIQVSLTKYWLQYQADSDNPVSDH